MASGRKHERLIRQHRERREQLYACIRAKDDEISRLRLVLVWLETWLNDDSGSNRAHNPFLDSLRGQIGDRVRAALDEPPAPETLVRLPPEE